MKRSEDVWISVVLFPRHRMFRSYEIKNDRGMTYIDRVPYFSELTSYPFSHLMQKCKLFIDLRHPVTILIAVFSNPTKLTNDLFIFPSENLTDL